MSANLQSCAGTAAALGNVARLAYARGMDVRDDDCALMLLYAEGDVAAFERLYSRHNDALFRYLLRLTYRREAAEDIFQDTWNKIINSRTRYRPTAKFRTYLFRVAHNAFIDFTRRNRRHDNVVDLNPEDWPADDDQPEVATELELARRRLESALRSLPAEQRDAFLLREEAGLSIDEIADVTGVKPETAKSRLRYAVRKLHASIEEDASGVGMT